MSGKLKLAKEQLDKIIQEMPAYFILEKFKQNIYSDQLPLEIDEKLRQQIYNVQTELGIIIKQLNDMIKTYPEYSDAYMKLIEAYLLLGNETKAMELYENFTNIKFDNINIPYEDLRPIFYGLARAYGKLTSDIYDKGIIENLMNIENERLDMEYERLKPNPYGTQKYNSLDIEERRQMLINVEIRRMIVNLELIRYYIVSGKKEEAINEYKAKLVEYDKKVSLFNKQDAKPITDLYDIINRDLENMDSLLDLFIDHKLLVNQKVIDAVVIPEGDNIDNRKFLSLNLIKDKEVLKLLTHIKFKSDQNHLFLILPSGNYTVVIGISDSMMVKDNNLPLDMELKREPCLCIEKPMIDLPLRNKTKIWIDNMEINFKDKVFSDTNSMKIDEKYKKLNDGSYKARIQTSFDIKSSQQISLGIKAKELHTKKEIIYDRKNNLNYYIISLLAISFLTIAM